MLKPDVPSAPTVTPSRNPQQSAAGSREAPRNIPTVTVVPSTTAPASVEAGPTRAASQPAAGPPSVTPSPGAASSSATEPWSASPYPSPCPADTSPMSGMSWSTLWYEPAARKTTRSVSASGPLRSLMSIRGSGFRLDTSSHRADAAPPATSRASGTRASQPSSEPRLTYPSTPASPPPRRSAPPTSIVPGVVLGVLTADSGTTRRTQSAIAAATKADTRNRIWKPSSSASFSTTKRDAMLSTAEPEVTMPTMIIAMRGAQTLRTIATERNTAARAAPCSIRPGTNNQMVGATAHRTAPAPLRSSVSTSTLRLPWMSALFPRSGAQATPASIAVALSHAAWSVPKWSSISGRTRSGAVMAESTTKFTRARTATRPTSRAVHRVCGAVFGLPVGLCRIEDSSSCDASPAARARPGAALRHSPAPL